MLRVIFNGRELRSKPVLTVVGKVEVSRPYYLCPHCHTGQFPADVELDIDNTEFSPGVRRMQAVVGQESPFDHGRRQMKLLAGLEVTTKAVERTAEAIGEDIASREQKEIQRPCSWICRWWWANRFPSWLDKGKSKSWYARFAPSSQPILK